MLAEWVESSAIESGLQVLGHLCDSYVSTVQCVACSPLGERKLGPCELELVIRESLEDEQQKGHCRLDNKQPILDSNLPAIPDPLKPEALNFEPYTLTPKR